MIFAGGMPRASYGDRFTVSVMQGDLHVVLDFTSKVVDFVTLGKDDDHTDISGELLCAEMIHSRESCASHLAQVTKIERSDWSAVFVVKVSCVHESCTFLVRCKFLDCLSSALMYVSHMWLSADSL